MAKNFAERGVLELASKQRGDVHPERGIVKEFATLVSYRGIRAAIKLQSRDLKNVIKADGRHSEDNRFMKRSLRDEAHVGAGRSPA
jgi:hypothetical protein